MTPINWPEGWVQREPVPHADRDASEPSMRERAERAESVARGQQRLIEAQRAEVERLLAEIADRESERADLRDRVEKAEAAVERVEALRDEWKRGYNSPTASSWASAHAERLSTALRGDQ